jgi:hypothetical protein
MKWVRINGHHINTDQLQLFKWEKGYLVLWFLGEESAVNWFDPQQKLYIQLCNALGVSPYKEDLNGEKRAQKL